MLGTIIGGGVLAFLILIVVWELVWKSIALWKAARNNHLVWFILLVLLNTAGILPIIYILVFSKKKVAKKEIKKASRKKR